DVGIDADRNIDRALLAGRDRGEQFKLRFGFDIDAENAVVDRERELPLGLSYPGEHDLVRGDARGARAQQLALRDHIGPGAKPGERRNHGLVGIRLQRIADERVDVGEGAGEYPIMPLERRARIAIERRADGLRERGKIDGLRAKHAVAIGEMMHVPYLEHEAGKGETGSGDTTTLQEC